MNQGGGEFMVSVKPKASLCDGNFHKISGETRFNMLCVKRVFLMCNDVNVQSTVNH